MDQTPNLQMPYILPSQAQKHVTHNEALRLLDAVVHLSVKSRNRAEAPETPVSGDRYLVAAAAAGAWAGKGGAIAFFMMADGCSLHLLSAGSPMSRKKRSCWFSKAYTGRAFRESPKTSPYMFGVHATADAVNRHAISSDASLFNNAGAGRQVKLNKQAVSDTASLLYQNQLDRLCRDGAERQQ